MREQMIGVSRQPGVSFRELHQTKLGLAGCFHGHLKLQLTLGPAEAQASHP